MQTTKRLGQIEMKGDEKMLASPAHLPTLVEMLGTRDPLTQWTPRIKLAEKRYWVESLA